MSNYTRDEIDIGAALAEGGAAGPELRKGIRLVLDVQALRKALGGGQVVARRPGMALIQSKKNPRVKRWQRTATAGNAGQDKPRPQAPGKGGTTRRQAAPAPTQRGNAEAQARATARGDARTGTRTAPPGQLAGKRFTPSSKGKGHVFDKPMPDLGNIDEFNKLPFKERAEKTAHLEDVHGEINERFGSRSYPPEPSKAMTAAREHLDELVKEGWIAQGNVEFGKKITDTLGQSLVEAGAAPKDVAWILHDAVRKLAHQEYESTRRTLGDHGMRHLWHNVQSTTAILDALDKAGEPIDAKDKAAAIVTQVHHDIGYTIPAIARGGSFTRPRDQQVNDKYHPGASAHLWNQERGKLGIWHRVLGEERAAKMSEWMRLHSSNKIEWKSDPVGTAIRVANNTHLFADKMPELLFARPGAMEALVKVQLATQIKHPIDGLKATMKQGLAGLPAPQRKALEAAVDEVSGFGAKTLASRLAGRDPTFAFKSGADELDVSMEQSPLRSFIGRVFGADQSDKQYTKMLEDFGVKDADPSKPLTIGGDGGSIKFEWTAPKGAPSRMEQQYIAATRSVLRDWRRVQDAPAGKERDKLTEAFFGKLSKADDVDGTVLDGSEPERANADKVPAGSGLEPVPPTMPSVVDLVAGIRELVKATGFRPGQTIPGAMQQSGQHAEPDLKVGEYVDYVCSESGENRRGRIHRVGKIGVTVVAEHDGRAVKVKHGRYVLSPLNKASASGWGVWGGSDD